MITYHYHTPRRGLLLTETGFHPIFLFTRQRRQFRNKHLPSLLSAVRLPDIKTWIIINMSLSDGYIILLVYLNQKGKSHHCVDRKHAKPRRHKLGFLTGGVITFVLRSPTNGIYG